MYLLFAFLTAFTFVVSAVVGPYLFSSRNVGMVDLKTTGTVILGSVPPAPPPPPPPPPPILPLSRIIFVPPVVVDSATNEDLIPTGIEVIEQTGVVLPPTGIVVVEPTGTQEVVEDTKPLLVVEENASFQGGNLDVFRKWVAEHIVYPPSAENLAIDGKVILQFVVGKKGKVEDVKILRGVDPLLDQEAIRVLLTSPTWKPGRQGGMDVRQQFSLPIAFKINR